LICLTILAGADRAHAMGYIVTRIADNSEKFTTFVEPGGVAGVTINEAGTVAFYARVTGGAGIFSGSGGPTTTIAGTSGPYNRFTRDGFMIPLVDQTIPAINDAGRVTFFAQLDGGGTGIFSVLGGATATIAQSSGPFSSFSVNPSINGGGTVAFIGILDSSPQGVFTGSGGGTTTIADTSGSFQSFGANATIPAINDAGQTAFIATQDGGAGSGIFRSTGGLPTTIAHSTAQFQFFGSAPSINNSGVVAFSATLDNATIGIFTGSGGPTATYVDSTGGFQSFGSPAINDAGTVAFLGVLDGANGVGIFTGPNTILHKVIKTGDALDDSTVTGILSFLRIGINEHGQIAFAVVLMDGRQGIFRADPDFDNDDVADVIDNCPDMDNPGQEDADGDGIGDDCDACPNDPDNDADGDGVCGDVDNCPAVANANQADGDGDGLGDACDICNGNDATGDTDGDGVCDAVDECPGADDALDANGNGTPDCLEAPPAPQDNPGGCCAPGVFPMVGLIVPLLLTGWKLRYRSRHHRGRRINGDSD
jgi:hypothetical protein